jgi:hypothetical protein
MVPVGVPECRRHRPDGPKFPKELQEHVVGRKGGVLGLGAGAGTPGWNTGPPESPGYPTVIDVARRPSHPGDAPLLDEEVK